MKKETKSRGHGPTHKPLDTFTILFRSSVGQFLNFYNLFNYIDTTIIWENYFYSYHNYKPIRKCQVYGR